MRRTLNLIVFALVLAAVFCGAAPFAHGQGVDLTMTATGAYFPPGVAAYGPSYYGGGYGGYGAYGYVPYVSPKAQKALAEGKKAKDKAAALDKTMKADGRCLDNAKKHKLNPETYCDKRMAEGEAFVNESSQ